jgi:hypothetical protein
VYLDYDRVIRALRAVRADTVWPGWGFVAEHPEFAERLAREGITFLGPSAETMRRLGDKIASKRIAEQAKVPVAPWSGGALVRGELSTWAERIGFPLVLKATAGGGGRGIRVVEKAADLTTAFDSATAEAKNAFGDGTLFMERRVARCRHVEVQMAGDRHGHVLALGLRDCSVQRKHQKVVEEGPPPGLSEELSRSIRNASVRLLREVGYVGVATCEYLVTADEEAVKYLRERKAFGKPIGDFQGMRWKAADMMIEIEAGRGLLYRAAVSGNPFPDPTMAAMAKIYCNEMAIRVTSQAVQVHGGYGYVDEFPVSRLFRGARFGSLGGGTTETLRNLVGRKVVEHMDLATGIHSLNMV